jgi:hypothetical protein
MVVNDMSERGAKLKYPQAGSPQAESRRALWDTFRRRFRCTYLCLGMTADWKRLG